MKNILFPTDFTQNSLNAFIYAMEYAQKQGSKLIVFHAYEAETNVSEETQAVYEKIDVENFRNKKDNFPPFQKLIKASKAGDLAVKYIVKQGDFLETLQQYVAKREDKIDLIIMGTNNSGKSNLFQVFMENKTIKVIAAINKPVIAVPEKAKFDGSLNNIAFLVDYKEEEIEAVERLIETSAHFGGKLHVIHFDLAHSESIVPLMDRFKEKLNQTAYNNVEYVTIDTMDLKQSLMEYCKENDIDIVCLLDHERNFYQRLFTFSLAEDLLRHIDIPVMAIYAG